MEKKFLDHNLKLIVLQNTNKYLIKIKYIFLY